MQHFELNKLKSFVRNALAWLIYNLIAIVIVIIIVTVAVAVIVIGLALGTETKAKVSDGYVLPECADAPHKLQHKALIRHERRKPNSEQIKWTWKL